MVRLPPFQDDTLPSYINMSKNASAVSAVSENVTSRDFEGLTRDFNDALNAGHEWSAADIERVCQSHGLEPIFLTSDVQDAYLQRRYEKFSSTFNHIIGAICGSLGKLGDGPGVARYNSLAMAAYKHIAFRWIPQYSTVTFNIELNDYNALEDYMSRAVAEIRNEGGYEFAFNFQNDEVDDATIYAYVEAIMNVVVRDGKTSVIYPIVVPAMRRIVKLMKDNDLYEDKIYDVQELLDYGLAVLLTC